MTIEIGKTYAIKNNVPVQVIRLGEYSNIAGQWYICHEYITHELRIDTSREIRVRHDMFDHKI